MDFWDQDYFRVSKLTSRPLGQWPRQNALHYLIPRGIFLILTIIHLTPRIRALVLYGDDRKIILEGIVPLMINTLMVLKTVNNWWTFDKMKTLFVKIEEDWEIFSEDELQILHQYTELGRRLSVTYLGAMLGGGFVFATEPLQLRLMYHIKKINETPPLFPMPVDYGSIDVDRYYWGLISLENMTSLYFCVAVISCDTLFFIFSYHVFGLFATLGHIIESLPIDNVDGSSAEARYIKRCVQIHYRATEFADEIEGIFIWSFFAILGVNMITISVTGVQITTNMDDRSKVVQYAALTFVQLVHLFVVCLTGQRLIDHSSSLQQHIWNSPWYHSSLESQKMIIFFLMRSQLPCQITGGKLLVMNVETFSLLVRTSASYFTVLLALQ